MTVGQKQSLRNRVEAALSKFRDEPQSVGFQFRLNLTTLLCELLDEKNWTQKQLAEEAGMKEAVVSRIINADSNCKFETAGRLLFALGVREGDIELLRTEKLVTQESVIARIGPISPLGVTDIAAIVSVSGEVAKPQLNYKFGGAHG